ncbi:hypothetical protein [Halorussus lipolyticus]|nr:hypothetical protein [Halorussus sp. DT80]
MSVAIEADAGSKAQYDSEFNTSVEDAPEQKSDHSDGCGFTCSPFSTW